MIIRIRGFKEGQLKPVFSQTAKITTFLMKPALNKYFLRDDWDRIVINREKEA